MIRPFPATLMAVWMAIASAPMALAGDYDQALAVLSQAFPEVKNIAIFYDDKGTLLNLLEFESSASKQFGVSIRLVPLDGKQRITPDSIRKICNQHRIQGILLLEDDPLITPGSTIGRAILMGSGRLPILGIHSHWLEPGAWFAVGPSTKGLQVSPKVKDAKIKEALRLAGQALAKEGS